MNIRLFLYSLLLAGITGSGLYLTGKLMYTDVTSAIQHRRTNPELDWLIGTWVRPTKKGTVYETWTLTSPHELEGLSYRLSGTDTLVIERIRITSINDELFYIPTVSGQNEEKPVYFRLVESNDTLLRFHAPEHDFPQWISYQFIPPDSLLAEISGLQDSTFQSISFPMKKVVGKE